MYKLGVSPILFDLPMPICTERMLIRPVQPGDGEELNEALIESWNELLPWMYWARGELPTAADSELFCRKAAAQYILRESLSFHLFDKQGRLLGAGGIPRLNWDRGIFEIGYWIRTSATGKGYVSEFVNAMTRYAFQVLEARRVEVFINTANVRSEAIPRRLGFIKEAVLKDKELYASDSVGGRDVAIYARFSERGLPEIQATW